jgi:hypothetical protein
MTRRERAVLARFLFRARGCRASAHADNVARMSASDDQAKTNLLHGPVPTGTTPGKRLALNLWGQALEKVGRRHDDLPAIRRGQRLQEANAEGREESDE